MHPLPNHKSSAPPQHSNRGQRLTHHQLRPRVPKDAMRNTAAQRQGLQEPKARLRSLSQLLRTTPQLHACRQILLPQRPRSLGVSEHRAEQPPQHVWPRATWHRHKALHRHKTLPVHHHRAPHLLRALCQHKALHRHRAQHPAHLHTSAHRKHRAWHRHTALHRHIMTQHCSRTKCMYKWRSRLAALFLFSDLPNNNPIHPNFTIIL